MDNGPTCKEKRRMLGLPYSRGACGQCGGTDTFGKRCAEVRPAGSHAAEVYPSEIQRPPPGTAARIFQGAAEVRNELARAAALWPAMNSAHEGYAVILEELDELKAHVWTKQKHRDLAAMRAEAIQLSAMALRFALEVCDEERGRR